MLTEFVARKCNEAIPACQKMLDFLNVCQLLKKITEGKLTTTDPRAAHKMLEIHLLV
jgi:hypothetical protein